MRHDSSARCGKNARFAPGRLPAATAALGVKRNRIMVNITYS
jgi:hypothetical protein